MSSRFLMSSDGRRLRAQKAIRKLFALGISQGEILQIMRSCRKKPKDRSNPVFPLQRDSARECRLRRACWAIRTLIGLGFTESDIAELADVEYTSITRALHPQEPRVPPEGTVMKLIQAVEKAGEERLKNLLPRVAITVLDTCCQTGREPGARLRAQIESHAPADLLNALVFASAPDPLVPGIHAFLAQVGEAVHGLYLIKVRPEKKENLKKRIIRQRLLKHEVEHLLQRIDDVLQGLERQRPNRHLPSDSHIA